MGLKLNYLNNIPIVPEEKLVLLHLGYHQKKTVLTAADRKLIEETLSLGWALCDNRGVWARIGITEHHEDRLILEGGVSLESRDLANWMAQSKELILMGATAGSGVMEQIQVDVAEGRITRGVILDAVASQVADGVLDWMSELLSKTLRREGNKLTRHRYSPGYGDLSLEYQRTIFDLLQLEELGLTLTEQCILMPEKSVIAIVGVERI